MTRTSLKLEDFSDRELLWALEEHADENGYVTAQELADGLGLSALGNPMRNVVSRLTWLKRYGIVERDADTGLKWGLTSAGEALIHARLSKAEAKLLENLDQVKLLAVMQRVGSTMTRSSPEAATMAQRDFRNAQATRKRLLAS